MDIEKITSLKDKSIKLVREVATIALMVSCIGTGFVVSEKTYEYRHKAEKVNPYTNIYSPKQISVAIDETENLLLIMKSTGEYTAFNDSIGQAIFKMYAKRIYHEVKSEKENK
jgi:hypothetical protein